MIRVSRHHGLELHQQTQNISARVIDGPECKDDRIDEDLLGPFLGVEGFVNQPNTADRLKTRLQRVDVRRSDAFTTEDPQRPARRAGSAVGNLPNQFPRDAVFRRYDQLRLCLQGVVQHSPVHREHSR